MSSVVVETLIYAKMYWGYNQKLLSTRVSHIALIGATSKNVQIHFSSLDQGGPKHLSLILHDFDQISVVTTVAVGGRHPCRS